MATKEEIRAKLLLALPYMRYAMKKATAEAPPGSKIGIGIQYSGPKGGKVTASFNAPEFFEDLATLIDAPAYTKEDEMEAKAEELLGSFGLK